MSGSLIRQHLCLSCLKVNCLGWEGRIKLQKGWGLVPGVNADTGHAAARAGNHGSVGVPGLRKAPSDSQPPALLSASLPRCSVQGPPHPPSPSVSRDRQLALTCPSLAHPAPHPPSLKQEPWTSPKGCAQGHRHQPPGPHRQCQPRPGPALCLGASQADNLPPVTAYAVQVLGHAARQQPSSPAQECPNKYRNT